MPRTSKMKSIKEQETKLETDVNKCVKLLASGDVHLINVEGLIQNFKKKPSLGDVLQYELHNYCKKNMTNDSDVSLVIKLANLCYSSDSVSNFPSMSRFVGCVCHISSYLLKREEFDAAIAIGCSLEVKKPELIEASKTSADILNFLYSLHSYYITSAISLASQVKSVKDPNYKYSQELAILSLKFFQFNNSEQITLAKNVLKKSKAYLHAIKHYKNEDITKFYEILKSVIKIMYSKFTHFDYCSYFIFKMDRMKNLDYSNGRDIFQQLEIISQKFLLLYDVSVNTKKSFSSLLNFFFISPPDSATEKCEVIQNCIDYDVHKGVLLFLLVSHIFQYGIQFWWKLFADDWNMRVSAQMVENMFTKMLDLHRQFCGNEIFYCNSTKSLGESCFGGLLIGNLHKIQYTIRLCLKNKLPNSFSLFPLSMEAFELSVESADIMKKMGCDKLQRNCAWKSAVIHQTNLIEDVLKWPHCDETWIYLRDSSRQVLRQIVNSEFELPYETRRVNILFQRWHQAVLKLKNFHDGLFVCVVFYVSYPAEETDCMSMWLQTKSECGNEIFQEMTVIELLKSCESTIKEFNSNFDRDQIDTKAILLMELKAYSFCADSTFPESKMYDLVARIWKQLEKMDLDLWETSFVYKCLMSTNISGGDNKLSEKFIQKCNAIVEKLSRWTFEGKLQCRSIAQAANLRLSLFLYNVRLVENSEGKMDTTELILGYLKKAEEEKVRFGEDADLNLTCNVVPTSSQLTVNLETDYLEVLKEIGDLWREALRNGTEVLPTPEELDFWLGNVQLAANLCELFGDHHLSSSNWMLFYRIGKSFNDLPAVLLGLSHLIKNCSDVNELHWMKESEEISDGLDSENKSPEVLVVYRLTIASNHLKNKRPVECLENLVKARKLLENFRPTPKTHMLQGKFWCSVSQFLTLYPDYEVEFGYRPGTDLRVIVFKAFNYANVAVRNYSCKTITRLECTELVLAMIEVDIWAFHFHEIYSQSDFMRFFLGDLYQIVQKLFLPTRTAEVLARLAEVDLICENSSDCQEKVSKLKSILTTLFAKPEEESNPVKPNRTSKLEVSGKPSHEREISPARFLKKPVDSCQIKDVSPIHYQLSDLRDSNAIKHGTKCKCRLCRNLLIQILTMTTLTLEGEIFKMENGFENGSICYSEAHKIYARLDGLRMEKSESLFSEVEDSLKMKSSRQLDFLMGPLRFYSARFLIRYAFFEASMKNSVTENAKSAMETVSRLMKKLDHQEKLLTWKFTELKLLRVAFEKGESKIVPKGTPKEYRISAIAKTPFQSRQRPPTSIGLSVKKARPKKLLTVGKSLKVSESEEELNSSDEENKAFINLNQLPSEKKFFIHPRKLRFRTNEPATTCKTVKKAPNARPKNIRPKKLNLDLDVAKS